ncbi:MAG: DCC1-like thiol-disulfide oxidoreductase family protein [Acidobacteriota bacterium]|nr:DCC1-like thiol-disulfide oxidoreductase family protein [Acidobacteriota bacterium]
MNRSQPSSFGWTGGQYSIYRVALAALCTVLISRQIAGDSPGLVAAREAWTALNLSPTLMPWIFLPALIACLALAVGRFDRIAAAYLLPFMPIRWEGPGMVSASVTLLLILHLFVPAAPYGSLAAKDRVDPAGDWRLPRTITVLAWIALIATCLVNGALMFTQAESMVIKNHGLVLLLFLLASAGFLSRFWAWTALLIGNLIMVVTMPAAPYLDLIVLQLLAFLPSWLPPTTPQEKEYLFYDGNCGLCHRAVRFVLAEDSTGALLRFAPLQGEKITELLDETQRNSLPDSLVLADADGRILVKSTAALTIGRRLGGLWRLAAYLGFAVPRVIRDAAYDGIARIRYKLFAQPKEACPLLPPHLRDRFEF